MGSEMCIRDRLYTCTECGETKTEVIPKTDHKYTWKVVSKATVFAPEKQQGTCSVCGAVVNRDNGKKLTATIKLNATSIKLQKKQTTKKIRVAMANGDSVRSWRSSNKKIATVNSKGAALTSKIFFGYTKSDFLVFYLLHLTNYS